MRIWHNRAIASILPKVDYVSIIVLLTYTLTKSITTGSHTIGNRLTRANSFRWLAFHPMIFTFTPCLDHHADHVSNMNRTSLFIVTKSVDTKSPISLTTWFFTSLMECLVTLILEQISHFLRTTLIIFACIFLWRFIPLINLLRHASIKVDSLAWPVCSCNNCNISPSSKKSFNCVF